MRNTFGNTVSVTLFGESHGPCVGAVLDGMAPGIPVDETEISEKLSLRRPKDDLSSLRSEPDPFRIVSGVRDGFTTGAPICLEIENTKQDPVPYGQRSGVARPAHCDYPAFMKYHGYEDRNGGGHFSGRLTAALVAVGAIAERALQNCGVTVGSHILRIGPSADRPFDRLDPLRDFSVLAGTDFPVLDPNAEAAMKDVVRAARDNLDSVGGMTETAVVGLPAGVGEPWFDSVESMISHILFSVPGVKGVDFGDGFDLTTSNGSVSNDPYRFEKGQVITTSNHMGGIGGGLTNGMPILFRAAVKPTPSIGRQQETIDFVKGENTLLSVCGRHDPCIVYRLVPVINAVTSLCVADLLATRFGTDYLTGKTV